MAYVVGGGAAALLSFWELKFRRSFRAPITAWHWWLLRLVLEGAQGALGVLVTVKVGALAIKGIDGIVAWALAGLFAPRLVRQLHFGPRAEGEQGFSLDLEDLFDRIRIPLENRIDGASAQAAAASRERMLRRLKAAGVSPQQVADLLTYIIGDRVALETKAADAEYVKTQVASGAADDVKYRLLIDKAKELHIYRAIRRLAPRWRHRS